MMNRGKKILMGLMLAVMPFGVGACSRSSSESGNTVEMTEDQKNFLLQNSMDQESVEAGHLAEWQIELLRKYDICMDFLSDQYPEHSFEITTADISNPDYTKFVVIPDSDEEQVFTVNVFEDGSCIASGTFE